MRIRGGTRILPNPRSFTEYVGGRFYNELCDAVTDVIEEKQDALDLNLRNVHTIDSIEVTDVEVKHVWVNDLPGMEIEFDVAVCAELYVHERDYHYDESETAYKWFMVSFRGDLEKELDDVTVTGKDIYNGKGRYQNPLDDALVPVIKPEQLEKVAEQFLRDYYPKALLQPMWLEPTELAGELGLKVIRKRITKDGDIFGRIFFYDAVTEIYDPDQDKMMKKKARAKMILVDPEAAYQNNIGALNNTIVHECVHWGLHRKAFMLEHLYNKELTQIGCVVRGGIAGNKKDSTDWMEWQANALAPRIQMPKEMFKKRVDTLISKFRRELGEYDIVDIIQPIIEQLTIDFGVSRTAAKLRLIDIGYDEAIGAFNYVDGRYVQPHKATPGFLQKNQTFSISARDAAILAWTNPFLKSVLEEGRYVYVDSHYRVRKSWGDAASQVGAFKVLENAKACADEHPGTYVFDPDGVKIYTPKSSVAVPFLVRISIKDLNIRKGPGTNFTKTGKYTGIGVFTIVEVADGQGSSSGWGRLKSGAGWCSLDFCQKI